MLLLALFACTDPKTVDTGTPDPGDTGDTGEVDDGLDAARDALRQKVKMAVRTGQASGAQVAVWKDGAIVFSEGIGTRDPDTEDPVLTTTLFEVGSDTKKMTAMALLQQVAAGRTTLDATVAEVLPGFTIAASPDWAATTTLHELLSHQGGLVDYTPFDDVPDDAELA
ncbi:MAG: serine hydrolase domain-containing protein, partial [Myxococcota bacterium]